MRQDHPCRRITIKEADVDELMIPLIKWLNSYESVVTFFCCQGEKNSTDSYDRPYVLFTCTNSLDLISILSTIGSNADVMIHWSPEKSHIEYIARFQNQERLLDTMDYVGFKTNEIASRMVHHY
jgi:tRNA(Phe) wybutosine-synthesizing methylase Tyw3